MQISESGKEQRRRASITHGARSFMERGEAALDQSQRSRLAEIKDFTKTPEGVIELLRERTAFTVMLAELAEAWIRQQAEDGIPFDQMTLMDRVTNFHETARRHLAQLAQLLPTGEGMQDITGILSGETREIKNGD